MRRKRGGKSGRSGRSNSNLETPPASTPPLRRSTRKRKVRNEKKTNTAADAAVRGSKQGGKEKRRGLPDELWAKILEDVDDNSVTAFACVNKQLRRVQLESGRRLFTDLLRFSLGGQERTSSKMEWYKCKELKPMSADWCLWSFNLASTKAIPTRQMIFMAASFWGHLDVLKVMLEQEDERTENWLEILGDSDYREEPNISYFWACQNCSFAAAGGHLEVLKFLRERRCPLREDTCIAAASEGHLAALKYVIAESGIISTTCTQFAARFGHLEVLKFLKSKKFPCYEETITAAARGGHLEVLKYLRKRKCPWDEETCEAAAEGGHLDVLKYLHEKGCRMRKGTCRAAVEGSHLEVLKYAIENGCPIDKRVCQSCARQIQNQEILNFLNSL